MKLILNILDNYIKIYYEKIINYFFKRNVKKGYFKKRREKGGR